MNREAAAAAPGHAPGHPGSCADCDGTGCSLRALCATPAPAPTPAPPQRPSPLGTAWSWASRPALRHRLPSLLVLAAAAAAAAPGPHVPALIALTVGTALALWWSAPRATAAGWPGLVLFAACAAVLAARGRGPMEWLPVAVGLGVAALRLTPLAALGAFALCALGGGVGALAGGSAPLWAALGWSGLGTALGLLVGERRRFAAREQQLLSSLALATAQAVLEANPAALKALADAGVAPPAENPGVAGTPQGTAEG